MFQKIRSAIHAATQLATFLLGPFERADAADSTVIGASALQRLTLEVMVENGKLVEAQNIRDIEEAVYLHLKSVHEMQKAHKRKVSQARQEDSFPQAPGRA